MLRRFDVPRPAFSLHGQFAMLAVLGEFRVRCEYFPLFLAHPSTTLLRTHVSGEFVVIATDQTTGFTGPALSIQSVDFLHNICVGFEFLTELPTDGLHMANSRLFLGEFPTTLALS